jgi:hypothetical protein
MVNTKVLAMNVEPIQMDITPAHRDLKGVVQIGNRAVAMDEQTPPHHGTNSLKPHLQLVTMGWFEF